MTDGTNIAGLLSALSGGADLSSLLAKVLSDGNAASKLTDSLGDAGLGEKLADMLKNTDLSSVISALGVTGGASSGTSEGASRSAAQEDGVQASADASGEGGEKPASQSSTADAVQALPAIIGSLGGADKERSSERRALLSALRPFVGERRRRAIDMLLGFEKLTAFLPGGK